MGRKKWNKDHPEVVATAKAWAAATVEPCTRVLAVHPFKPLVAVAVAAHLRVYDVSNGTEHKVGTSAAEDKGTAATAATTTAAAGEASAAASLTKAGIPASFIRLVAFSPDGHYLLAGGDDKQARLWRVCDWSCAAVWTAPKKISAGAFTPDSRFVLLADKFGEVLAGAVPADSSNHGSGGAGNSSNGAVAPAKLSLLLGHFNSIITDIAVSPDSSLVATADRDFKTRISMLPAVATQGSHEIQSFCLGHTAFVSSCALIQSSSSSRHTTSSQPTAEAVTAGQPTLSSDATADAAAGSSSSPLLLVTGSGDGSVRLWDPVTGRQLDVYTASQPYAAEETTAAAAAAGTAVSGAAEASTSASAAEASGDGGAADAAGNSAAADAAAVAAGSAEADAATAEADAADGEGADEDADVDEAGGGDEGGDGGSRRAVGPACAPVLSVSVSPDGRHVAVVVEGQDELQILSLDNTSQKLQLHQQLTLSGLRYPCKSVFDAKGRLWVIGGVPLVDSQSVHLAVAERASSSAGEEHYVDATDSCMTGTARSGLEARVEEEEARVAAGGELASYSQHLQRKRRACDPAHEQRKKLRRNDREIERLNEVRAKQDKVAASKQQPAESTDKEAV